MTAIGKSRVIFIFPFLYPTGVTVVTTALRDDQSTSTYAVEVNLKAVVLRSASSKEMEGGDNINPAASPADSASCEDRFILSDM